VKGVRQVLTVLVAQLFAAAGVAAIEHADFEGVERLALVLGGEIVSTFDTPDQIRLGHCEVVEEIMIGEDKVLPELAIGVWGKLTLLFALAAQV